MAFRFHIAAAILALVFTIVHASDPSPLQDFCVAVPDANAGGGKLSDLVLENFMTVLFDSTIMLHVIL